MHSLLSSEVFYRHFAVGSGTMGDLKSSAALQKKWSEDDLAKGAALAADLAGLELAMDPCFLSKEALIQAIQDPFMLKAPGVFPHDTYKASCL